MNEAYLKIIPPILIFFLGYFLKRKGIFKRDDGDIFLKLVFYVSWFCLNTLAITNTPLNLNLLYLPIIAPIMMFSNFLIALYIGKWLHLPKVSLGVFLIAIISMNTGIALPFILSFYGTSGIAKLALFDIGNVVFLFSFVYALACKYGNGKMTSKLLIQKVLLAPPIWAIVFGLILNLSGIHLSPLIKDIFQSLGNLTVPLIMLSLGFYFNLKIVKLPQVTMAMVLRMVGGLFVGLFLVHLFHLEGASRLVVLLCAASPSAWNTLTLTTLENLDKEFAASIVSLGTLIGIFYVPLVMVILK